VKRFTFLLMFAICLGLIIGTGSFSPGWTQSSSAQWSISTGMVQAWPYERLPEQFFYYDHQLFSVSIQDGQLVIHQCVDNQWVEYQRLLAKSNHFTTVWVSDFDWDNQPEIIAGTDEPGFLYIYALNQDSQWTIRDNSKYLWSNINHIVSGRFTETEETEFIAQNSEGSLFYLKRMDDALNIVWKSPSPWRQIRFLQVIDIDGDSLDEILVSYQNGSLAVLKIEKNAVVSQSENYPWGKVLAVHFGDWNQDGKPGFMVTTSQKVNYILSYANKSYRFIQAPWQSNYLIENIQYVPGKSSEVIVTDSAGNTHILGYNPVQKRWNETQVFYTGRIAQIIPVPDEKEYWLLGHNRQINVVSKSEIGDKNN